MFKSSTTFLSVHTTVKHTNETKPFTLYNKVILLATIELNTSVSLIQIHYKYLATIGNSKYYCERKKLVSIFIVIV